MVSAVVFDLEGTLIDLSEQHILAYREVLGKHFNIEFTKEDFLSGYGRGPHHIIRMFLERHGIEKSDVECRRLADEKQVVLREKYSDKVRVLPGVRNLLNDLTEACLKVGLASSSPRRNVEFMLKNPGLWDYFQVVVAMEDVPEAKPDPRIFLLAAEKLNVKPAECVAVEDSVHGVRAAKDAGMKVVGVLTGGRKRDELEAEGADLVVEDLTRMSVEDLDFV